MSSQIATNLQQTTYWFKIGRRTACNTFWPVYHQHVSDTRGSYIFYTWPKGSHVLACGDVVWELERLAKARGIQGSNIPLVTEIVSDWPSQKHAHLSQDGKFSYGIRILRSDDCSRTSRWTPRTNVMYRPASPNLDKVVPMKPPVNPIRALKTGGANEAWKHLHWRSRALY